MIKRLIVSLLTILPGLNLYSQSALQIRPVIGFAFAEGMGNNEFQTNSLTDNVSFGTYKEPENAKWMAKPQIGAALVYKLNDRHGIAFEHTWGKTRVEATLNYKNNQYLVANENRLRRFGVEYNYTLPLQNLKLGIKPASFFNRVCIQGGLQIGIMQLKYDSSSSGINHKVINESLLMQSATYKLNKKSLFIAPTIRIGLLSKSLSYERLSLAFTYDWTFNSLYSGTFFTTYQEMRDGVTNDINSKATLVGKGNQFRISLLYPITIWKNKPLKDQ